MKKKQRLELRKESIRHLGGLSLRRAAGGYVVLSFTDECNTEEMGCAYGFSQLAICNAPKDP